MNQWEHLTQVPESIRLTMSHAFVTWEKQDLGIQAHIEGTIQSETVTMAALKAIHETANEVRIPILVRKVKSDHPSISLRDSFKAVSLFVGLGTRYIQKIYYREKRCSK